VTALKRRFGSQRPSTDWQQLSLAPALRGLGNALGAAAGPRLEFRSDLRQRLLDEARLLAAQPKTRPRSGRPRRPKGGGIRLAAIGIGFSLAGGGVVAAAHSLTLPAKAGAASPGVSPAAPLSSAPPHARSAATPDGASLGAVRVERAPPAQQSVAPTSEAVLSPPASSSPLPMASAVPPVTATLTGPASAGASALGQLAAGRLPTAVPSDQPSLPILVPSWPYPLPSLSASPLPLISPLR
jgi:hypothetical protein